MPVKRALLAGVLSACAAPAFGQQTVGVFVNDTPQPGLTLNSPVGSSTSYLIDNGGLLVHSWQSTHQPGRMAYVMDNGHLVRSIRLVPLGQPWTGLSAAGGGVEEFDWEGNLLWTFEYAGSEHMTHHDMEPLANGNVLLVAWERVPEAEAIAEGKDPALVSGELWLDHIVEVQPVPPDGGTIVWEWHIRDHLIQDADPTKANFGVVGDHPELIDFNFSGSATDNSHVNSIDYEPLRDQILISARAYDEIWVIDHSTTTAEAAGQGGDLLYRWGNPQAYRRGTPADQQLFGQHDASWITPGNPGAGNMLIFNNGAGRLGGEYSSVEEIVPPVDQDGFYVEPAPGEAFAPAAPLWSYAADPPESFFSRGRGGAERQPNGNTLICESDSGHFFEVEPDGDVVWDYVNPVNAAGAVDQGADPGNNGVFKVRRYPFGSAALAGKVLTPGDPLEQGFTAPLPVPQSSPLLVERLAADGSSLRVEWDAASCPSFDYDLIWGELPAVSSWALSGAQCAIGTAGDFQWSGAPAADLYLMVVGVEELGLYESSWGLDSSGAERAGTQASFQCGTTTKVVTSTCP